MKLGGVLLLAACAWSVIEISSNPIRSPNTPPERATILDRHGEVLAYTELVKTRPGERKAVRRYPEGPATAHVLGFIRSDDRDGSYGQEGLELAMDKPLSAKEDPVFAPTRQPPVVTTIDRDMQRAAHKALVAAAEKERATAGAVVVLDKWGHIRALASYPNYNPDETDFRKKLDLPGYRVLFNHYASESFSPGELITPLLAASWVQHVGVLQMLNVDLTPFGIHGEEIRDVHDHPPMSVSEAVAKSSKVAHAKIALQMAPKHWTTYLRSLNLGDYPRTQGIPGETPGRVPAYCQLNPKRLATLGFPQVGRNGKLDIDATAEASLLQIAGAYLPLANGGGMPKRLSLLSEDTPALDVVLSKEAVKQTREMLEEAVSHRGTGFKAQVAGIRVGGKTATIRMPPVQTYSGDPARSIGAFVGLAPIDDEPQYVIAVMLEVEGPGKRILLGGEVAAPVFAQIVRDTMTVARRSSNQH
jgi:cell division protein FtsI (penicillin-binding protein 3)